MQFLKRSIEALERYEAALAFYRDIGDRLGEANTLVEIGILQENLTLGLEYCQAALERYTQIGTKYSQSRNLIYFTSKMLLKLGRQKEAVDALNRAIELAREIPYQIFVEDATAKLQEIQENHDFHSQHHDFHSQHHGFHSQNHEFHSQNHEFHSQNHDFH